MHNLVRYSGKLFVYLKKSCKIKLLQNPSFIMFILFIRIYFRPYDAGSSNLVAFVVLEIETLL